jgi:hypothetical protein
MRKSILRMIGPRLLIFTLVFATFIFSAQAYRVSAEEKTNVPYLIKVNRTYNTVTVYKQDDKGKYKVPVKVMLCSVGKSGKTVTGTYKTKDKYRWKLLNGDVWGQYATRIVGGILFHSVYYYENGNPATLATKEFNKLGEAVSHGCVRLAVEDAKWIYDNCSYGTSVIIYDDKKSPGPLGKPEGIKIASSVRWDPTDPDVNNPYADKTPTIDGIKSSKIAWNSTYDVRSNLKATSSVGTDITSAVKAKGEVNTAIPGKYKVIYTVTDTLKKSIIKTITVIVLDNTELPEFDGISDRVVNSGVTLDSDFALTGVDAYCQDFELDKDLIQVTIDQTDDMNYEITYSASIGNGPIATITSKITIDDEAPIFNGITDRILKDGEIPDLSWAMTGVTITDNYSTPDKIILDLNLMDNFDGTYQITYTATDEAGNIGTEQIIIGNKTVNISNN